MTNRQAQLMNALRSVVATVGERIGERTKEFRDAKEALNSIAFYFENRACEDADICGAPDHGAVREPENGYRAVGGDEVVCCDPRIRALTLRTLLWYMRPGDDVRVEFDDGGYDGLVGSLPKPVMQRLDRHVVRIEEDVEIDEGRTRFFFRIMMRGDA